MRIVKNSEASLFDNYVATMLQFDNKRNNQFLVKTAGDRVSFFRKLLGIGDDVVDIGNRSARYGDKALDAERAAKVGVDATEAVSRSGIDIAEVFVDGAAGAKALAFDIQTSARQLQQDGRNISNLEEFLHQEIRNSPHVTAAGKANPDDIIRYLSGEEVRAAVRSSTEVVRAMGLLDDVQADALLRGEHIPAGGGLTPVNQGQRLSTSDMHADDMALLAERGFLPNKRYVWDDKLRGWVELGADGRTAVPGSQHIIRAEEGRRLLTVDEVTDWVNATRGVQDRVPRQTIDVVDVVNTPTHRALTNGDYRGFSDIAGNMHSSPAWRRLTAEQRQAADYFIRQGAELSDSTRKLVAAGERVRSVRSQAELDRAIAEFAEAAADLQRKQQYYGRAYEDARRQGLEAALPHIAHMESVVGRYADEAAEVIRIEREALNAERAAHNGRVDDFNNAQRAGESGLAERLAKLEADEVALKARQEKLVADEAALEAQRAADAAAPRPTGGEPDPKSVRGQTNAASEGAVDDLAAAKRTLEEAHIANGKTPAQARALADEAFQVAGARSGLSGTTKLALAGAGAWGGWKWGVWGKLAALLGIGIGGYALYNYLSDDEEDSSGATGGGGPGGGSGGGRRDYGHRVADPTTGEPTTVSRIYQQGRWEDLNTLLNNSPGDIALHDAVRSAYGKSYKVELPGPFDGEGQDLRYAFINRTLGARGPIDREGLNRSALIELVYSSLMDPQTGGAQYDHYLTKVTKNPITRRPNAQMALNEAFEEVMGKGLYERGLFGGTGPGRRRTRRDMAGRSLNAGPGYAGAPAQDMSRAERGALRRRYNRTAEDESRFDEIKKFTELSMNSINNDDTSEFFNKKADKFSNSYYKDAVNGLSGGDEELKSYYTGLGRLYNKKRKKPKADYDKLYDVSEGTGVDLIHAAHPKAIVVLDSIGRGGLVENGLEQKRQTHGVALSTPTGNFRANYAWLRDALNKTSK